MLFKSIYQRDHQDHLEIYLADTERVTYRPAKSPAFGIVHGNVQGTNNISHPYDGVLIHFRLFIITIYGKKHVFGFIIKQRRDGVFKREEN